MTSTPDNHLPHPQVCDNFEVVPRHETHEESEGEIQGRILDEKLILIFKLLLTYIYIYILYI